MDVTQLYPSIPTDVGMLAMRNILKDFITPKSCLNNILNIIYTIMTVNIFSYEEKLYLQTKGTAMGTPIAVIYAIIFLHWLEKDIVDEFKNKGSLLLYIRFIDDIFTIFNDINDEKRFYEKLNQQNTNISITGIMSAKSVPFLDLWVYLGNRYEQTNKVDLLPYQKEINKYLYLPPFSYHEDFSSFISGELKRYVRNSSNLEGYLSLKRIFRLRLKRRGYKDTTISNAFRKVTYNCRKKYLLSNNNKNNNTNNTNNTNNSANIIRLICTRNPVNTVVNIKDIINQHKNKLPTYFANTKLQIVYRNAKNIGRKLRERRDSES
tara:strand:- start:722 stop:1684 length:963 start_codon:yes stop_codon:yes gene_type:complete